MLKLQISSSILYWTKSNICIDSDFNDNVNTYKVDNKKPIKVFHNRIN